MESSSPISSGEFAAAAAIHMFEMRGSTVERPGLNVDCLYVARDGSPIIFIGEAPGGVMRRHFYEQSSPDPQGILVSS